MSHIFPRHTKQLPPVAVRGEGVTSMMPAASNIWMPRAVRLCRVLGMVTE